MSAEEWLELHAIKCVRHRGRWSRQACADALATVPSICSGCPQRPVEMEPSAAGKSLLWRMKSHAFVRYGSNFRDPHPKVTTQRIDPYKEVLQR